VSKNTFLVLGIDAATFTVIKPNLDRLVNFEKLLRLERSKELILTEKPISPLIWCGMFSGKSFEEHGHDSYMANDKIVRRGDIDVKFIWDYLEDDGKDAKALNVPFVVPPYSFGVDFKPVAFCLPSNEKEWEEELERVTECAKKLLEERPHLLVAVYTLLDRVQHFHWGEDEVIEWYEQVDKKLGELLFNTGFLEDQNNKLIVISDHGFCSFGEAKIQTLPQKTQYGVLKGDHSEKAMLITANLNYEIKRPQDVFFAIKETVGNMQ
jgi:predicted AlkP superfamily phosphohydrolase/phosphomutase